MEHLRHTADPPSTPLTIFWDVSCHPPDPLPTIIGQLKSFARIYGRLGAFRAYGSGFEELSTSTQSEVRGTLEGEGVELITWSRSEAVTIESLILVDLFCHALDHHAASSRSTTLLIVSDPTPYFHGITALRARGHSVVLVGSAQDQVGATEQVQLSWGYVMQRSSEALGGKEPEWIQAALRDERHEVNSPYVSTRLALVAEQDEMTTDPDEDREEDDWGSQSREQPEGSAPQDPWLAPDYDPAEPDQSDNCPSDTSPPTDSWPTSPAPFLAPLPARAPPPLLSSGSYAQSLLPQTTTQRPSASGTVTSSGAFRPTSLRPPLKIPREFQPMIDALRAAGGGPINRGVIGSALKEREPGIYERLGPGMEDFKSYSREAARRGIVKMGGTNGKDWIALRTKYR